MLDSTLIPNRATHVLRYELEPLQGGILLRCGVCLQGTMSRAVFMGSQCQSCGES
jgi:uncharacterized protein (DUF983 family)